MKGRRALRLGVVLALAAAVGPAAAQIADTPRAVTRVRGTRVSMWKPSLFVAAEYGGGFLFPNGGAEVQVTEIPRPYAAIREAQLAAAGATPGMKLGAREDVRIDGHDALLLVLDPQDPKGVSRWLLVLGDERSTVQITALGRAVQKGELDKIYRRMLLSTRWDTTKELNPYEALPFLLAGRSLFQFSGRYFSTLTFTRDGRTERESPDDPILVVSVSNGRVEPERYESVCRDSSLATAAMADIQPVASGLFQADGMRGCEVLAEARSVADGRQMMIYDAVLFEKGRLYSFKGIAGVRFRAQYVTEFARMARQIRRK